MKIIGLNILGSASCKIIEQTHRNDEFGKDGKRYFIARNGVQLRSSDYPDVRGTDSGYDNHFVVFMRGMSSYEDDRILSFRSNDDLLMFIMAVNEYNGYFSSHLENNTAVPTFNCTCKDAILCEECIKDPKKAVEF